MANHLTVELRRMLRNKRYLIFVAAFPVAFYLLFSGLYGGRPGGATGVYLMVSMAAYGALAASVMSTAVPWSQERQTGWLRQLQVTPVPGWKIIVAKLA